jgi:hypothetical protein
VVGVCKVSDSIQNVIFFVEQLLVSKRTALHNMNVSEWVLGWLVGLLINFSHNYKMFM